MKANAESKSRAKGGDSNACHAFAQGLEKRDGAKAFEQYLQACKLGRTDSCDDADRLKDKNPDTQKKHARFGCDAGKAEQCKLLSSLFRKENNESEADVLAKKSCTLDEKNCEDFAKETQSRVELLALCDSKSIGCDRLISDFDKGILGEVDDAAALSYRKKACLAGAAHYCESALSTLRNKGQKREAKKFEKTICETQETICDDMRDRRRRERVRFFFYTLGARPSFESNPFATNVVASGGIEDDTTLALFPAAALSLDAEAALRLSVLGKKNLKAALKMQSLHLLQLGGALGNQRSSGSQLLGASIEADVAFKLGRFEVGDHAQLSLLPGRFFRLTDDLSMPLSPTVYGDMSAQSLNQLYANVGILQGDTLKLDVGYRFEISVLSAGPLIDSVDSLSALADTPWFGPGSFGEGPEGFADKRSHLAVLNLEYDIDDVVEGFRLLAAFEGGHTALHDRAYIPLKGNVGVRMLFDEALDFTALVGVATLSSEQEYPLDIVASAKLQLAEFPVSISASRELVVAPTLNPSIMNQVTVNIAEGDKVMSVGLGNIDLQERSETPLFRLEPGDPDVFIKGAVVFPFQFSKVTIAPYALAMFYLSDRAFNTSAGNAILGSKANHSSLSGGLRLSWTGSL